jgi:LEA14-like dessication related protein
VTFKAVVVIAIVVAAVSGLFYYQATREVEAIRRLGIEIADASITRLGLFSCDIAIKLKYTNPLDYDTPTFWVSNYSIYVNGELVGTSSAPPTKVAARSTVYQDLTVTIEYAKVSKALVDALREGKIVVEVRGEVRAKVLFGLLEVLAPFTSTYSIREQSET